MSSRLLVNGRMVVANRSAMEAHRDCRLRGNTSAVLPSPPEGGSTDTIRCGAQAIPPGSGEQLLELGIPWRDPETGIIYRVSDRIDARDGWASTAFWQKRWQVGHDTILRFTELGYLDAVIGITSQVRRYRCRSEQRVLRDPLIVRQAEHRVEALARQHTRRNFPIRIRR